MKKRAIILTILLAAALGWFVFEQKRGKTREAEEGFLDFLVANARETLASRIPEKSSDVILVEFREQDKAEYSAWPPAPIDYIMALKRLPDHEPRVVVVTEPLRWEKADMQFITQLRTSLLPFSTVHGFHVSSGAGEATPEQREFAGNEMPVLPSAEGDRHGVPKFTHVTKLADAALRIASQSGISTLDGKPPAKDALPFVMSDGKQLVPTLAAQAVTLFHRKPYAVQRLRFGTGARWSLGDAFIIPLRGDGSLPLAGKPQVPAVNALELMTPDLEDAASKVVKDTLGRNKVVVLANGPGGAEHAHAIATALAMSPIRLAPAWVEWTFAGLACLFCFWQLRHGRLKALITGVAVLIAGLGICLLAFQSAQVWWPPLAALLVISAGTLFCFLWPAKPATAAVATIQEPEASSAGP